VSASACLQLYASRLGNQLADSHLRIGTAAQRQLACNHRQDVLYCLYEALFQLAKEQHLEPGAASLHSHYISWLNNSLVLHITLIQSLTKTHEAMDLSRPASPTITLACQNGALHVHWPMHPIDASLHSELLHAQHD